VPAASRSLASGTVSSSTASPTSIRFSFEDGGTDGWIHRGHVTALQNAAIAHDGVRSLQVSLFSSNPNDLPFIQVGVSGAGAPQPGQTVSLFAQAAPGSTRVLGQAYVQDTRFTWHIGTPLWLPQGGWAQLTVVVPAGIGVIAIGVQFLCTPTNAATTAYVDSVR
jgi:hypothetical protein